MTLRVNVPACCWEHPLARQKMTGSKNSFFILLLIVGFLLQSSGFLYFFLQPY